MSPASNTPPRASDVVTRLSMSAACFDTNLEELVSIIEDAVACRAWESLGMSSLEELVVDTWGTEDNPKLVDLLRFVAEQQAIREGRLWKVPAWASTAPGGIRDPVRYLRAKMLDHSEWQLPGSKQFADIDLVLDADGHVLFSEMKPSRSSLESLPTGQSRLMSAILMLSDRVAAAVVEYATPPNQLINTRSDVVRAEVLWSRGTKRLDLDGDGWRTLVSSWAHNALRTIAWLDAMADEKAKREGGAA